MKEKPANEGFFSWPKFYWSLSDEEIVERIEKSHKRFRKLHRWLAVAEFVILTALFVVTLRGVSIALDFSDGNARSVWAGYVFGAMMGGFFGFYLLKSALLFAAAVQSHREHGILLRSWNRCKQLEEYLHRHGLKPPPADSRKP